MQYKDWLPFKDAARKYSLGLIGRNEFIDLWRKEQERQMYPSDFIKGAWQ